MEKNSKTVSKEVCGNHTEKENKNCCSKDGVLFTKGMKTLMRFRADSERQPFYYIPDGVVEIAEGAFKDCKSLREVTIPRSVKVIGGYAFSGCKELIKVNIFTGVTKIGAHAFEGCKELVEVYFPKSIVEIGNYAFSYCVNMENISIPESVIKVGDGVFYNTKLRYVTSLNQTPPLCDGEILSDGYGKCILYTPKGTKDMYSKAIGWKSFTSIVEMDDNGIRSYNDETVEVSPEQTAPEPAPARVVPEGEAETMAAFALRMSEIGYMHSTQKAAEAFNALMDEIDAAVAGGMEMSEQLKGVMGRVTGKGGRLAKAGCRLRDGRMARRVRAGAGTNSGNIRERVEALLADPKFDAELEAEAGSVEAKSEYLKLLRAVMDSRTSDEIKVARRAIDGYEEINSLFFCDEKIFYFLFDS